VEVLEPGVCEAEFSDDSGRMYATVAVDGSRLLPLLHETTSQTA